jgi:hypothetical protein
MSIKRVERLTLKSEPRLMLCLTGIHAVDLGRNLFLCIPLLLSLHRLPYLLYLLFIQKKRPNLYLKQKSFSMSKF